MQKQKTIAKWLTVILLTTIAVGAYILSNIFVIKNGGAALGTGQTNQGDANNPDTFPPTHIPVYSTFPRKSESIKSIDTHHVGGEKDDIVEGLVVLGNKKFLFVSSASNEYDTKESGLLLAFFIESDLVSVAKFASINEHVVDTKLSAEGIVVLTETADKMCLYQFSIDGNLTAKSEIGSVKNPKFYLWEHELWMFFEKDNSLSATKISNDLTLKTNNFVFSSTDAKVKVIIPYNGLLMIVTESQDATIKFVTFSQIYGFKCINQFDKMSFLQLTSINYENELTYYMLAKDDNSHTLVAFADDFSTITKVDFPGTTVAHMRTSETTVYITTSSLVYSLCRHLDKQSENLSSNNLTNIISSYNFKDFSIIANLENNKLSIYKMSAEGNFTSVFECKEVTSVPQIVATPTKTFVALSSRSTTSICHMNFGGSDAFLFLY